MQIVFEFIGMGAKKYGGFERYILEEAKQLSRRGGKLIVVFDCEPLAKEYINDLLSNDVSYYIVPYARKLEFAKRILQLFQKYKPDVIHTNFSSNGFIVHPLALLRGVPHRIMTEHCVPVISTIKLKLAFNLMACWVHHILPVSEGSAKAIKKGLWFGKNKVQTLYLGVDDFSYDKDEMRIKYNLPKDKILLMNIAYHNPVKGVDVLLRAFADLLKNHCIGDIVLCQIGSGQTVADTDYLKNLSRELGIENQIIWMGLQNKVPEILAAGDIYCQPSRSEGIALSIMEAALAKLPIVATKVGGIPEAAQDGMNAILVAAEEFKAMSDAIYKFYIDSDMRKKYGTEGRIFALKNFCLKNQVDRLITSYYKMKDK